jgi:hypothetical protein
VGSLQTY